ncbi:MAG: hypothetical protein M1826_006348 [Phylliscum demangeonii]|nr:MAG: hypothetical protein M1826_006348 [Phylliscum demangeonii]
MSDRSSTRNSRDDGREEDDDLEKAEAEMMPLVVEEVSGAAAVPATTGPVPDAPRLRQLLIWTTINLLATVGIVFVNKNIFDDPSFRQAQSAFAAFHFFVSAGVLWIASSARVGMFQRRRAPIREMIPLAVAMCLNVILPNVSLAFSSVTFYQIARILLTPVVALVNYVFYRSAIPRPAAYALAPICLGVAIVSYYDSRPVADAKIKTTSSVGVVFALVGVMASAVYTVWIGVYHKKLKMSSMQLLLNQAPISCVLLLYVIPFSDRFPNWGQAPLSRWMLILLSGLFASLINLSQFFIIAQAGPVSSTVVGQLKTCCIVALGWITSGRTVGDRSILGVLMAIGGIMTYSVIMLKKKA